MDRVHTDARLWDASVHHTSPSIPDVSALCLRCTSSAWWLSSMCLRVSITA